MNVYKRNGHTVMYNTIDDFGALLNTSIAMNKPNVIDFDLLKQKYSKTNGQILYEHSEVVGFTIKDNDPVVLWTDDDGVWSYIGININTWTPSCYLPVQRNGININYTNKILFNDKKDTVWDKAISKYGWGMTNL